MPRIKVTIVGLGAIGCSIGLALRQADADVEITGHDKEPLASRQAQKINAVHKTDWNLIAACENADIIVLAIPLGGIRDTLQVIGSEVRQDCVITDTATVKATVTEWASELLPEGVHFVGGNPIVVSDGSGSDAASPDLFQEQTWCVTSSPKAPSEAIELVTNLISTMGAQPYFVDALEHDSLVAATDHLPLVLMAALLDTVVDTSIFRELSKVGGPQLARMTAPITGDAETFRDICLYNKDNLVRWIGNLQRALEESQTLIEEADEASLNAFFAHARDNWVKWLKGDASEEASASILEEPGVLPSVRDVLFGRLRGLDKQRKED
jgi:prephenate dehydrogenase